MPGPDPASNGVLVHAEPTGRFRDSDDLFVQSAISFDSNVLYERVDLQAFGRVRLRLCDQRSIVIERAGRNAGAASFEESTMNRQTLADLNLTFRSSHENSDFVLVTEYRVGRYGLRISRDGYSSRGLGGKLKHLVVATVIREIKPDYNWRAYCADQVSRGRNESSEKYEARKTRQVESHGQHGHFCRQPQVGDVVGCRQVCVGQNAIGRGAFDGEIADTTLINCSNCLVRFFHEEVEPRAKVEAREKAERAAAKAKNPPPTCPHCGDVRPRTKATERGERPLCSWCKDATDRVATYTKSAETGLSQFGFEMNRDRAIQLRDEAQAELDRREGKYA
jgi:hypothetical protein